MLEVWGAVWLKLGVRGEMKGIQGYKKLIKSYYIFTMPERKAWTNEEDTVLKALRDE